jgi:ABC-2 type transport system permease protein
MPLIMVLILALVQEFGWNAIAKEPKIQVLFVNETNDSIGALMEQGLRDSKMFLVLTELDSIPVTGEMAREKVRSGDYQIGVIIPEGTSAIIDRKVSLMITRIMTGLMMPTGNPFSGITNNDSVNVTIYFDPAIMGSFKHSFLSKMKEFTLRIESAMIFKTFNTELRKMFPQYQAEIRDYKETFFFNEEYPSGKEEQVIATTTQHNIPSWAIFAMFFIVIPLSSSIIREREEGSMIRLHTLPVPYMTVFMAKVGVYLFICFVQFFLMVLAGILVMPLFGLPALNVDHGFFLMIIMALASSLAALGFGIMVGTLTRTLQQAAAVGVVAVVILAALGGLWVPLYFFPKVMLDVASCSPLQWAHSGFLDIFVRGGSFSDILPELTKLIIFFVVTIGVAAVYRKINPPIPS